MTFTGELATIMGATFGVTTVVVGLLMKQLLKTSAEKTAQELQNVRDACTADVQNIRDACVADVRQLGERVKAVADERKGCEEREDRDVQRISGQVEKLRDKWEKFVKEDAAMEATRGRKVEALFGVVDSVKDSVRELPDVMSRKMDVMYRDVRKELKSDIREEVRTALARAREKTSL